MLEKCKLLYNHWLQYTIKTSLLKRRFMVEKNQTKKMTPLSPKEKEELKARISLAISMSAFYK